MLGLPAHCGSDPRATAGMIKKDELLNGSGIKLAIFSEQNTCFWNPSSAQWRIASEPGNNSRNTIGKRVKAVEYLPLCLFLNSRRPIDYHCDGPCIFAYPTVDQHTSIGRQIVSSSKSQGYRISLYVWLNCANLHYLPAKRNGRLH